jgi:Cu-processing system permease protein
MLRILAVAVNTFREAVRDRVLNGLLGVALCVLVFTLALAELSLDQRQRIVLDIGLASISLFSVVMAVFLGSSLLYKEIERKTLYVILPKPIRRHEFLLGKYLGIVLTAFVFIAIMGALQLIVTTLQQAGPSLGLGLALFGLPGLLIALMYWARDRSAVLVPWSASTLAVASGLAAHGGVELWPILAALLLSIGEVLVLTAVALVFSAFSTPFLTALFSIGVWLVGRSADMMIQMKGKLLPELAKAVLRKLARVWPNFNLFVPGPHTLHLQPDVASTPGSYVASTMLYALFYSALLLAVASLIFRRRDFL